MGVRGLSTFVHKNRDQFLVPHQLSNCHLVIDGDNLVYRLNSSCRGLSNALGGDYSRYAAAVRQFFNDLTRCRITAVVMLDGGSDPSNRKRKTAFQRLSEKLEKTRQLSLQTQDRITHLPLLSKLVLLQVLRELHVPHVQCDFEADEHLAALARQLDCAVLSDDTDFFAFGVQSVPLSSLASEPRQTADGHWHMECKLFQFKRFMDHFQLSPALMPLFACLLGNDYIHPRVLDKFFRHHAPPPYGQRRGRPADRRIRGLLTWLRKHSEPDTALQEVLSMLKKEERAGVEALVRSCLASYCRAGGDLFRLRQLPAAPTCETGDTTETAGQLQLAAGVKFELQISALDVTADCVEPSSTSGPGLASRGLPAWLLAACRRGGVTSDVINLITGQPLLQEPQVEDFSLPPACLSVLPLLQLSMSLLSTDNATSPVDFYHRQGSSSQVQRRRLTPSPPADLPRLGQLADISADQRQRLLLSALGADSTQLNQLPAEFRLLAAVLIFWRRAAGNQLNSAQLTAVFVSWLVYSDCDAVLKLWPDVGLSELSAARETLRPLTVRPAPGTNFNRRLVHRQAELQCIVQQVTNLTGLLSVGRSLPEPSLPPITAIFNGTLLYMATRQLLAARSAICVLQTWLGPGSILAERFIQLLQTVCAAVGVQVLSSDLLPVSVPDQKQTDSKKSSKTGESRQEKGAKLDDGLELAETKRRGNRKRRQSEETVEAVAGNRFAALLMCSDSETESDPESVRMASGPESDGMGSDSDCPQLVPAAIS